METTKGNNMGNEQKLQEDVDTLLEILRGIYDATQDIDYSQSPVMEKSPCYLLGRISSMARGAAIGLRTVKYGDYVSYLERSPV